MKSPIAITYNPNWRKPKPKSEPSVDLGASSVPDIQEETIGVTTTSFEGKISTPPVEEHEPQEAQPPLDNPSPASHHGNVAQVHFDFANDGPTAVTNPQVVPSTPPKKPRPKMSVTWDDPGRKLRKKGYPPAPPPSSGMIAAPPTSEPTPEKPKSSFFSRLSRKPSYPPAPAIGGSTHPYHEVDAPPSPPPSPGWRHHEFYFPEYTPIYPSTTFADPYARPYLLTPGELQAQQHAARVGHAVAVHYPMLPPFNEYGSGAAKGQGAWQSGQWGATNWTGFGLNGERLPDGEGKTFGAPMPKGVLPEKPKAAGGGGGGGGDGGGAAKKKGGEEGGGGGAEAPAPDAAAAAAVPEGEAAAAGEGGGGGGEKKKKK